MAQMQPEASAPGESPLESGARGAWLWGAAGLALVVAYLWARHRGFVPLEEAVGVGSTPLHDFEAFFYPMGEQLMQRQRPIDGFFYSPTAAAVFAVLAVFPYAVAAGLWGLVVVVCSVGVAWSVRRVEGAPWRLAGLLGLSAYPMLHGLKFGQVSAPLTLLVIGSLLAYRSGKPRRSAVLLGAAVAVKYYAAVFLLFYVARRDWRTLGWALGACAVGLVLLPGVLLGPSDAWAFYRDVAVALQAHFGAGISDPNSQSFTSVVHRVAPGLSSVEPFVRIGLGLSILAWAVRLGSRPEPRAWSQAFAVLFAATPFWVVTSWPHYFVFIPWCCAVVWAELGRAPEARGGALWWAGHVCTAAAAGLVWMPVFDFFADRHAFVRQGYLFVADVAILLGLLAARRATATASAGGRRWLPGVGAIVAVGALVVPLVAVLGRLRLEPYDDAYFFKRFALNLLDHGVYAWNVADGAVHGNTSQLHQLVLTAVTAAAPSHTIIVVRILLAVCVALATALLVRRAPPDDRPVVALVMLSPMAIATVWTGMETATVLALEAAFVAVLLRDDERFPTLAVGLGVGLYLARPDTLLLTTTAIVLARIHRGPKAALAPAVAMVAGVAVLLGVFKAYYGTALPMSFYLKSGQSGLYDAHFVALSRLAKRSNLCFAAVVLAPVLYVLGHRVDRRMLVLATPPLLFIAYHAVMTVEVMGMQARFYAPALPFLAVAAAHAYPSYRERHKPIVTAAALVGYAGAVWGLYAAGWIPTMKGWPIGRTAPAVYGGYVIAAGCVLLATAERLRAVARFVWVPIALGVMIGHPTPKLGWPSDRQYLESHQKHVTSYRGLPQLVECLGTDLNVYHSEVGVVGLVFRDGKVTDLGGLMTPELTFGQTDFATMCARDRPDAIFLPHRNYQTLNRIIQDSGCLSGYRKVVQDSSSPLYVRLDRVPQYRCKRRRKGKSKRRRPRK